MNLTTDTIVAPATAAGRGGIGIVRLSGPQAANIGLKMLGKLPEPRRATIAVFADGAGLAIDAGLALWFPAPGSFTGEDVLELHGHGGPVVIDLLTRRALELGARMARPGEFTERAFLNDKIDLAQAEAVADLIDASSEQAARAALRSLAGEFSAEVQMLAAQLLALRVYVEAAIDFPDEEVGFLGAPEVLERIADIGRRFDRIEEAAGRGRALREGLSVVIAGRPNAGKSSLLNALAGHEAAIVTEVPGTTRDLLRESLNIDGVPVHIVDTAGLRDTNEQVEAEGVRRARAAMGRAERVLYVVDASQGFDANELAALPAGVAVTVVWNKTDLPQAVAVPVIEDLELVALSAKTGAGLDELRAHLKQLAGYQSEGGAWSARRRHLDALARARELAQLAAARLADRAALELVAEDLRLAHTALGEITGEVSSDDLLGEIFSSFCIGK